MSLPMSTVYVTGRKLAVFRLSGWLQTLSIARKSYSGMAVKNAQDKFLEIMRELNESDKASFLTWIDKNWNLDEISDVKTDEELTLNCIAADLRSKLSLDAVLPSETIAIPLVGPNSDCDPKTTVHLDEFLYDDNYIDKLIAKGQISRYYCTQCYSKDVKLLTFISHSMSIKRIVFLFTSLLPPLKEKDIVLDVGSRLGGVLYGSYLLTVAQRIIGVELNRDLCQLQENMVEKYNFSNRIEIVCANIFERLDLLSTADVIIINNVFEFFTDASESIRAWCLLGEHIKLGSIIVTIPHLSETFSLIQIGFNWEDWVEELPIHKPRNDSFDDWTNHQHQMKHYRVKKQMKIS